jgi:hypothetical protein
MWQAKAYAPPRCLVCTDHLAEFADIAVGDAWLPEFTRSDDAGTSIAIARTETGETLLVEARRANAIHLSTMPIEKAIKSQPTVIDCKRLSYWGGWTYRLAQRYREFGILAQEYGLDKSLGWRDKALATFRLMSWRVLSSRYFLSVSSHLPESVFWGLNSLWWRLSRLRDKLARR